MHDILCSPTMHRRTFAIRIDAVDAHGPDQPGISNHPSVYCNMCLRTWICSTARQIRPANQNGNLSVLTFRMSLHQLLAESRALCFHVCVCSFSVARPHLNNGPAEQVWRSNSADTPRLYARLGNPACTMGSVLCSLVVQRVERRGKVGHMTQASVRGVCT